MLTNSVLFFWDPILSKLKESGYSREFKLSEQTSPSFIAVLTDVANEGASKKFSRKLLEENDKYHNGDIELNKIINLFPVDTSQVKSVLKENFYPFKMDKKLKIQILEEVDSISSFLEKIKFIKNSRDLQKQVRIINEI